MVKKKRFIGFILALAILLIAAIACGILVPLYGGSKTEEQPIQWWKDYENYKIILEDERSDEKSFCFASTHTERIFFNYTYNETYTSEYIPKARIFYKGEEKFFYTKIVKREWFFLTPDGYNWEDPHVENVIKEYGGYRVQLALWLNEKDGSDLNNYIDGFHIYIIIHTEKAN